MEKVILTKQQAAALKSALRIQDDHGSDKSALVSWKVQELFSGDEEALNQLNLETFIQALYLGYELEQSPEEKVLELFLNTPGQEFSYNAGIRKGILQTIELLGMHIKGVNC